MYSLYAFASALAADLFVRALRERTPRTALAAALAAWLLPAIHPYGAIAVAAEALVGLWIWRGKPLRPALPVLGVGLALVPFLLADVRLAQRFSVGLGGETSIASPGAALGQVWRAVAGVGGRSRLDARLSPSCLRASDWPSLIRQGERAFVSYAALPCSHRRLSSSSSGRAPSPASRRATSCSSCRSWPHSSGSGLRGSCVGGVLRSHSPLSPWSQRSSSRRPRAASGSRATGQTTCSAVVRREPRSVARMPSRRPPHGSRRPCGRAPSSSHTQPFISPHSLRPGDAVSLPYAQTPTLLRSLERIDTPVRSLVVSVPIGATTARQQTARLAARPGARGRALRRVASDPGEGPIRRRARHSPGHVPGARGRPRLDHEPAQG